MNSLLQDLLGHQAWADAEHWRAIESYAPAREDKVIYDRLHHIHQVQRLFIWAIGERNAEFAFSNPEHFKTFEDLKAYARGSHAEIDRFLSDVTDGRLSDNVTFSWFKDPPLVISVGEALTQCAMHSQ